MASLCLLVLAAVTTAVGARLLLLGMRNRQVPELAFGVAFLSGALGTVGAQLGQRFWWTQQDDFAAGMNAVCFGIQVIGTFALYLSTWRIFRPSEGWAFLVFSTGGSLAVLSLVMRLMNGDFPTNQLATSGMAVFYVARMGVFAWAAWESLHYFGMLRRRLRLGLADPVVAQQIQLWGITAIATIGTTLSIVTSVFVLGRHPLEVPASLVVITATGLFASASMWCAFFPPQAVRRLARRRLA